MYANTEFRKSRPTTRQVAAAQDTLDVPSGQTQEDIEQNFSVMLENASDAVLLVDHDGQIRADNARARSLFGYKPGQLPGQSVDQLVPAHVRGGHQALRKSYMDTPSPRPMGQGRDLNGVRADGSEFPAEISLSNLNLDGRLLILVFVSDITERKRAEEAVVQAGKMAAIGELAGNIAHEVNNPIGIISAKARLLISTLGDELPDKAQLELEKMIAQCDRLGKLTRGLLDFSRPSVSEMSPIDIHGPLRTALGMVSDRLTRHRVELHERLFAQDPLVMGSENELQQVFLNLLLNAIDAIRGGGQLALSSDLVGDGDQPDRVAIRIRDDGQGIPAEQLDKIFEPFFTTKQDTGTGLGLSICAGLVRSHGGTLTVDSCEGEWTEFTVTVPLTQRRGP